jgi:DNA-binding MarR family transcriptional regulator/RimJ/RimL family protein N-acetyltransferase
MQPYVPSRLDLDHCDRVESVREASRRLVRELGFMGPSLIGTQLPPSAVHALIEIGQRERLAAWELCEVLNLDKSSVSRMLQKLIRQGELVEVKSGRDARSKLLCLTRQGQKTLEAIHRRARRQVESALCLLAEEGQQAVLAGLSAYADALRRARTGQGLSEGRRIDLYVGYHPGAIGRIAELHGRFYAKERGFGSFFEAKVAQGVAEFASRLEKPMNGLWLAVENERILGSVAVDGEDLGGGTAHLRWFILDESLRGQGWGRRLLGEAVAFCDRLGFARTRLWTLEGLEAARHLYEAAGFTLKESFTGSQWGKDVTEQVFQRNRGGTA